MVQPSGPAPASPPPAASDSLVFVSEERKRVVLDDIAQGSVPRLLYYVLLTLSAGIAACLALGMELEDAVGAAKRFVTEAIRRAPGLGRGHGPINHGVRRPL